MRILRSLRFRAISVVTMGRLLSGFTSAALLAASVLLGITVSGELPHARLSAAGSCGPMTFDSPTDYAAGSGPQVPAVGDLDGDGDDDLVIPNYNSSNLTVLLSTPTGFAAAIGSPVALTGSPLGARIADFTGDDVADVAVSVGHDVVVIHGNGDGTFLGQSVTDVSQALTPQGGSLTSGFYFSAGDLDGDLDLDLVLAAVNAQKVAVWTGDGTGGFTSAQEWEDVGTWPASLAVGDMNGDARLDIAVGDSWNDESATGSFVYIFVQQLDGTFANPVSYETYKSVRSLALADLDGDTDLELIAPAYYGHGFQAFGDHAGRVTILFGNGDGTFGNAIHPLTGAHNPDSVSVADFDGDGALDIATSNHNTAPAVSILRGDGVGGFAAPVLYTASVGGHPTGLVSGDFDANSLPDLAWFSDYTITTPALKVMMNATECDFTPPVITPTVTGDLGGGDWYIGDVSVEWDVTDDESPIDSTTGCEMTNVTTDTAGTDLTCEATSAGGPSSQTVTIKRDATPPTATASAGPPPNASGWRKTNVTITFSGADALSGGVTCDPQVVLTAELADQSASGYCYDAAGNQSAPAVVNNIDIDKTGPTISITNPTNGAVFNRNEVVLANYSCADALSGVATCSGTVANGQPLVTSKKAPNAKFTVTATDLAGNTTKVTVTYAVR